MVGIQPPWPPWPRVRVSAASMGISQNHVLNASMLNTPASVKGFFPGRSCQPGRGFIPESEVRQKVPMETKQRQLCKEESCQDSSQSSHYYQGFHFISRSKWNWKQGSNFPLGPWLFYDLFQGPWKYCWILKQDMPGLFFSSQLLYSMDRFSIFCFSDSDMLFLRGGRVTAAFSAVVEPLFHGLSTSHKLFCLKRGSKLQARLVFSEGRYKVRTS